MIKAESKQRKEEIKRVIKKTKRFDKTAKQAQRNKKGTKKQRASKDEREVGQ